MNTDKFFRPDGPGPAELEWDGVPKVLLSHDQLMSLYEYVPQWHGVAVGPPLPWSGGKVHARVEVTSIFHTSREDAESSMELHMRSACDRERLVFDRIEWAILHLRRINDC